MEQIEYKGFKLSVSTKKLGLFTASEVIGGKSSLGYFKFINTNINDNWLDLGANFGMFSLAISKYSKEVISFEPDKKTYSLLEKNIEDNDITNCKLMNFAIVGNNDKERTFYIGKRDTCSSLSKTRGREEVIVKCMNINDVLKLNNFNKIKMDIEGAEYEVLFGIKSFKGIEQLFFEHHFIRDLDHRKYYELINMLKDNFEIVDYKEDPRHYWSTNINCKMNKNNNLYDNSSNRYKPNISQEEIIQCIIRDTNLKQKPKRTSLF